MPRGSGASIGLTAILQPELDEQATQRAVGQLKREMQQAEVLSPRVDDQSRSYSPARDIFYTPPPAGGQVSSPEPPALSQSPPTPERAPQPSDPFAPATERSRTPEPVRLIQPDPEPEPVTRPEPAPSGPARVSRDLPSDPSVFFNPGYPSVVPTNADRTEGQSYIDRVIEDLRAGERDPESLTAGERNPIYKRGLGHLLEPGSDSAASDGPVETAIVEQDDPMEVVLVDRSGNEEPITVEPSPETAVETAVSGGPAPSTASTLSAFGVGQREPGQTTLDMFRNPDEPGGGPGGMAVGAAAGARSGNAEDATLGEGLLGGRSVSGVAKVALTGGIAYGILKGVQTLSRHSPRLSKVEQMFGQAMSLFFRPFGDALGQWLQPWAENALEMAKNFNKIYKDEGLSVAVEWLADEVQFSLATAIGDAVGAVIGEVFGLDSEETERLQEETGELFTDPGRYIAEGVADAFGIEDDAIVSAVETGIETVFPDDWGERPLDPVRMVSEGYEQFQRVNAQGFGMLEDAGLLPTEGYNEMFGRGTTATEVGVATAQTPIQAFIDAGLGTFGGDVDESIFDAQTLPELMREARTNRENMPISSEFSTGARGRGSALNLGQNQPIETRPKGLPVILAGQDESISVDVEGETGGGDGGGGGGFSLPGLATGGLVTSPQERLVGEAGPELVVPYQELKAMFGGGGGGPGGSSPGRGLSDISPVGGPSNFVSQRHARDGLADFEASASGGPAGNGTTQRMVDVLEDILSTLRRGGLSSTAGDGTSGSGDTTTTTSTMTTSDSLLYDTEVTQ